MAIQKESKVPGGRPEELGSAPHTVAKDNSKNPTQGSVGGAPEHKQAIIVALRSIQECHKKTSETWTLVENAIKSIEKETNPEVLLAKRKILLELFKKEINTTLS